MNGLVSLIYQPGMPDVAQEAMDALSKLHEPDKIELWNPEAPINTFWDLSSQVRNIWLILIPTQFVILLDTNKRNINN